MTACLPAPVEKSYLASAAQWVALRLRRKQSKKSDPEHCYTKCIPLQEELLAKVLKQNDIYIVRNNIIKAIKVHYFTHPYNLSILLYLICDKIVEKGYLM